MSYEDMEWTIYLVRNEVNGKGYVGITTKDIVDRINEHVQDAEFGSKYALHAAIRKYGSQNFTIEVLKIADGLSEAKNLETEFIVSLDTYASGPIPRNGYNMSYGGEEPD
jgi:group I intron endonuclease